MAKRWIEPSRSEEASTALAEVMSKRRELDAPLVQTEAEATAYWQQCEREVAAEREAQRLRIEAEDRRAAVEARKDKIEHHLTEGLEVATSIAAGALSTWKTSGGFAIGETLNGMVGLAAKAGSVVEPESRPLRAAVRAGKVLLHSEISIFTRDTIEKNK